MALTILTVLAAALFAALVWRLARDVDRSSTIMYAVGLLIPAIGIGFVTARWAHNWRGLPLAAIAFFGSILVASLGRPATMITESGVSGHRRQPLVATRRGAGPRQAVFVLLLIGAVVLIVFTQQPPDTRP